MYKFSLSVPNLAEVMDSIIEISITDGVSSFYDWDAYHVLGRDSSKGNLDKLWWLPEDISEDGEFGTEDYLLWAFDVVDRETGDTYILTEEALIQGIQDYIDWQVEEERDIVLPGSSNFDAECVDIVLQFALFGEVVYG